MSITVRPGQVYVPRPDHRLHHQKIVVLVEDGKVRLAPYGPKRGVKVRKPKTYLMRHFLKGYRLLWEKP